MKKTITKIVFLLLISLSTLSYSIGQTSNLNTITKSKKITMIELGSVRCIPCQRMMPVLDSVKKMYNGRVKVLFYDVWTQEGRPYATQYGINVIPTQVFLDKNGKEYFRHTGFFPYEQVEIVLKQKVK